MTTNSPALTFSMELTLTKSGHFWTTYLPCLVNVVCECLLLTYFLSLPRVTKIKGIGAKAIARSRGVFMIVDHLSSSLNLFRIVTIYLWFSNLICFALQVSHTIRTFILYWGGYIYQGYLSDICTHMQTSKHILLCSF